jgi:hypothetical protein
MGRRVAQCPVPLVAHGRHVGLRPASLGRSLAGVWDSAWCPWSFIGRVWRCDLFPLSLSWSASGTVPCSPDRFE